MTTIPQRHRETDGQTTCHGNRAVKMAEDRPSADTSVGKSMNFSLNVLTVCICEYYSLWFLLLQLMQRVKQTQRSST